MREVERVACILHLVFLKSCGSSDINVCVIIANMGFTRAIGLGRSKYARKRRQPRLVDAIGALE